jgi:hypothetical protein
MIPVTGNADHAGEFIFDWNEVNRRDRLILPGFTLFDETLREVCRTRASKTRR